MPTPEEPKKDLIAGFLGGIGKPIDSDDPGRWKFPDGRNIAIGRMSDDEIREAVKDLVRAARGLSEGGAAVNRSSKPAPWEGFIPTLIDVRKWNCLVVTGRSRKLLSSSLRPLDTPKLINERVKAIASTQKTIQYVSSSGGPVFIFPTGLKAPLAALVPDELSEVIQWVWSTASKRMRDSRGNAAQANKRIWDYIPQIVPVEVWNSLVERQDREKINLPSTATKLVFDPVRDRYQPIVERGIATETVFGSTISAENAKDASRVVFEMVQSLKSAELLSEKDLLDSVVADAILNPTDEERQFVKRQRLSQMERQLNSFKFDQEMLPRVKPSPAKRDEPKLPALPSLDPKPRRMIRLPKSDNEK